MEKVKEITLFVTKTGKYAVKRSDKMRPSRYFTTEEKAHEWIADKYEVGKLIEQL